MKTKLFFGMLTAAATLAVAPAVFADEAGSVTGSTNNGSGNTYTDGTSGSTTIGTVSKEYKRSLTGSSWTGVSITTNGTVGGYKIKITGANDGSGTYTTDQDLYFTGGENSSLTITELVVENGETSSGGTYETTKAFIVEGTTVILSGVTVEELGMNLVVGTEYGAGNATLVITNGSNITTGAYYNTVGSNLNTGTITITGEGSTLSNQQITLGGGVNSLSALSSTNAGDYWTKCFVDQDEFNAIKLALASDSYDPTSGSYGIVNVTDGGTWKVGVGSTGSSTNKLQLSNGEINIDGGSLIFGANSSLLMCNENLFSVVTNYPNSDNNAYPIYTGMNISEKVTVKNGGTVSVEGNGTMTQLVIGETYVADNVVAVVSVDGSDSEGTASSFIISASTAVYIGASSGYWTNTGTTTAKYDGGTADVTVSATNGGVIDISSAGGMVICADNYATYIGAMTSGVKQTDVGHSYGLKVAITAESGGSLTLAATDGSTVLLAAGSPFEGEYKNTLTITADGTSKDGETASSVSISGGDIYTNYGDKGEGAESVFVEITATNGGKIALSAAKVDTKGNGVISFGLNTKVTVEKGSSLTTEGIISFESGASISVDATSKWTTTGTDTTVTFNNGSGLAVGAAADASGDGTNDVSVALGSVTIAEGASITVTIDISALDNYTSASVAILTAESIIFGGQSGTTLEAGNTITGDSGYSDTLETFVTDYIVYEENGFTIDSWSYTDGTLYANITTMPEPSMFGMLFGLSALGLVSTRRRRRKA